MGSQELQPFPCLGAYFFVPAYDLSQVVLPENAEIMLNEALPDRNIFLSFTHPEFAFQLGADVAHYDSRDEEKSKSAELIPVFMDILCLQGIAYVLEHRTACVKFHRDAYPDGIPIHTAKIIPFPIRPRPTE